MAAKKIVLRGTKQSSTAKVSKGATSEKAKKTSVRSAIVGVHPKAKTKRPSKSSSISRRVKNKRKSAKSSNHKSWVARLYFRRPDIDCLMKAIADVRCAGNQLELMRVSQRFYNQLANNVNDAQKLNDARVPMQTARNILAPNIAILCLSNMDERKVTPTDEIIELLVDGRGESIEDGFAWIVKEFAEHLVGDYVIDVPKEIFDTIMSSPRRTGSSFGIYHSEASGREEIVFDEKEISLGFGQKKS